MANDRTSPTSAADIELEPVTAVLNGQVECRKGILLGEIRHTKSTMTE